MMQKKWQQPASFRGKPFFVAKDGGEFGRRGAHHEFPKRDKGYWEDLGQLDDVFTLECYTTERSPGGYAAARDAVIAAAKEKGAGELAHPYYGRKQVVCIGISVTHDKSENGIARFTLTFVDAAADASPAQSADLKSEAHAAAGEGVEACLGDFDLTVSGVPGFVSEATEGIIGDVSTALQDVFPVFSMESFGNASALLNNGLPLVSGASALLKNGLPFVGGASALLKSGLSLVGEASRYFQGGFDLSLLFTRLAGSLGGSLGLGGVSTLARRVAGLTRLLSPASGSWNSAYTTQKKLWSYGGALPAVPATTPARRIQAANQTALVNLVQRVSLFEAARCVPFMQLESRTFALNLREELTGSLDAAAEKTASDAVYYALENMRRVVVEDLNSRAPSLAQVASYTPAITTPALALSYELYETPHRAEELVSRNGIVHPGRIPGGVPLEVLRA